LQQKTITAAFGAGTAACFVAPSAIININGV